VGRFRRNRVIMPLHSNLFMEWPLGSLKLRGLKTYLNCADTILALGTQQKLHLLRMGFDSQKVVIFPNTCELQPITQQDLLRKHSASSKTSCLFLSNLIDTKGYPEYVEACCLLQDSGCSLDAVLCGAYVDSGFNKRFSSFSEVKPFIEQAITQIQSSGVATLTWVQGAQGAAKQVLFEQAQIFVFPTRIAAEAQPLVIIEAMATGAAIITSSFRELPDLVDASCAIVLDEVTPQAVAAAMKRLIDNPQLRVELATHALARFEERFSSERFTERWKKMTLGLIE
ncbi:MAG TPA: glycosyltransferase family 4 protein, partial [Opitutales bacterium]|nr:glycosyltransferase family 4 protein [Opitutales bacterium]